MKNEISNLSKALVVLLYDQYDCQDLDCEADEESFVEYIIQALIEKNENICPFKNYDCVGVCKNSVEKCEERLRINCSREAEGIWKEFIRINESEEE